jgi:hypothetical protein
MISTATTQKVVVKGYWEKSSYISVSHTGRWSKYGGAIKEVAVNQFGIAGVADDKWFCQSCNTQQPIELTPYLFEHPKNERIRVCSPCFNTNCEPLRLRLGGVLGGE